MEEGSGESGGAAAAAPEPPVNIAKEAVLRFSSDLDAFLSQLRTVWPRCQSLKKLRLTFDVSVTHAFSQSARDSAQHKVIGAWHAELSPFYTRIQAQDANVFEECKAEIVSKTNMAEKYASADVATRGAIWQWLSRLNNTAQLWNLYTNVVPTSMMTTVQNATGELASKIQTGERAPEELLNLNSLTQIGMQVANQLEQGDIDALTRNMTQDPSIFQNMSSMFTQLAQQMPPPHAAQATAARAAPEVASAEGGGPSPPAE